MYIQVTNIEHIQDEDNNYRVYFNILKNECLVFRGTVEVPYPFTDIIYNRALGVYRDFTPSIKQINEELENMKIDAVL